jgi:hypothetical protein
VSARAGGPRFCLSDQPSINDRELLWQLLQLVGTIDLGTDDVGLEGHDPISHLRSKDRMVISELMFVGNGNIHLDDIRSPGPQFSWLSIHSSTLSRGAGCTGEICLPSVTHPIGQLDGFV